MIFEIQTVYQKEDIEGLSKAYYYSKRPLRAVGKLLSWLNAGLGLLLIAVSLFMLLRLPSIISSTINRGPHDLLFVGISMIMTMALFLFGIKSLSKSNMPFDTKLAWKLFKPKGERLCYRFEPDHIWLERPNVKSEIEYKCIQRLFEDKDRFYLFDSPQTAFVLPKRDFQQGNIEAFRDFIAGKTGKTVESI